MTAKQPAMKASTTKKVMVTQIGSRNRCTKRQRATLQALGLGRLGSSIEQIFNPSVVGMLKKVSHLVTVRNLP